MSLKTSDKIIAIIGVIILIAAGIGIYLYAIAEDESKEPMDEGEKINFFNINYKPKSMPVEPYDTYPIKPKLIGTRTITKEVEVDQQNIKSIKFVFDYVDNKAGFLNTFARGIGADTLTVTVRNEDGEPVGSISLKGDQKRNDTIEVTINKMILLEPIEAEDIEDAQYILEERFIDYKETYTVTVSLRAGLWGRIREILGQDSYGFEIICDYYDYTLEPVENDDNPGDDEDNPPTGGNIGTGIFASTNFPLTKL